MQDELPEYYEPKKAFGGEPKKARPYYGDSDYIAQPKIDGVRYHIKTDKLGIATIYSRSTSVRTGLPVDKTDTLRHLAREAELILPPSTVLDGEVMCAEGHRTTFKDVTRITGATPEKALQRQQLDGFLRFAAFDLLAYQGRDLSGVPLYERLYLLNTYVGGKYIFVLETAHDENAKLALRERIVAEGGEGLILKNVQSIYNPKRNKDWIKDKFIVHKDVIFMGIEMAKDMSVKKGDVDATPTRIAGLAGAIRFGQLFPLDSVNKEMDSSESLIQNSDIYDDSLESVHEINGRSYVLREIGKTSGFDDEMRMDLTLNGPAYGNDMRVFTVRAQMQYQDSFALREPRFEAWRDDKTYRDCIYRADER